MEGFSELQRGNTDVFVCSVIPGNYYLSKLKKHNIKIVGETSYSYTLRMAVRKDWSIFTKILSKTLETIPVERKTALYRDWVWIRYEHGFDYSLIWKIGIPAIVVIVLFAIRNRRLAAEICCRKKAEAALSMKEHDLRQSYAQLKETEDLKDSLVHMIVHDMRSPLCGVMSMLQLIRKKLGESNGEETADAMFPTVLKAVHNLTEMVQSLLDVNRLESQKVPIECSRSELKALAESAANILNAHAEHAEVTIAVTGERIELCCDANLICRVFTNLIGNAVRASKKGASVKVCIRGEHDGAIAEVVDSGCGIPKDDQAKIFDKFAGVSKVGERMLPSVGLGLTFCKLAVEAHGGSITVISELGKGSTFRFELPKKQPTSS